MMLMPTTRSDKIKLLVSIAFCLAAGGVGSIFTSSSVGSWYQSLEKPSFNPPSWVFSPVWTTLYILMGIALYLIWRQEPWQKHHKIAMGVFAVQLFLNVLWSFFFFYLRQPGLAFFEILLLWLSIATTIWMFGRLSAPAALLLLPYIAWVTFASLLNFAIWQLNS